MTPRPLADDKGRSLRIRAHPAAPSLLDEGDIAGDDVEKRRTSQQRQSLFRAKKKFRMATDLDAVDRLRLLLP